MNFFDQFCFSSEKVFAEDFVWSFESSDPEQLKIVCIENKKYIFETELYDLLPGDIALKLKRFIDNFVPKNPETVFTIFCRKNKDCWNKFKLGSKKQTRLISIDYINDDNFACLRYINLKKFVNQRLKNDL